MVMIQDYDLDKNSTVPLTDNYPYEGGKAARSFYHMLPPFSSFRPTVVKLISNDCLDGFKSF